MNRNFLVKTKRSTCANFVVGHFNKMMSQIIGLTNFCRGEGIEYVYVSKRVCVAAAFGSSEPFEFLRLLPSLDRESIHRKTIIVASGSSHIPASVHHVILQYTTT